MTPKQKAAVAISAVVLLAGAGYLYYEFVWKAKHKPAVKPDEPAKPSASVTTPPPPPVPDKPVSQYGFKPGEALYAKENYVTVYSYPNVNNAIGSIVKSATSQATFKADSSEKGWIKATAKYTKSGTATQTAVGDVFIAASKVTNVAP